MKQSTKKVNQNTQKAQSKESAKSQSKKPSQKAKTNQPKFFTPTRKAKMVNFFKHFLIITQGVASLLFLTSIFSLNIIDLGLLILLIGVFAALLALTTIKLLKQQSSLSTKIICALISFATIVAALAAFRYTDAANSFLNKITEKSPEFKEYSVLVLKNSDIKGVNQLKDQSIGFLRTDPDLNQATAELKNVINFTPDLKDTIDTISTALTTEQLSAIVLESSRYDALAEDEFPITKITNIIYRFSIKLAVAEDDTSKDFDPTTEPFIIYISGSDSRTGIKSTARSDVNILTVVNPTTHKILLVSIPRDFYVQLHSTTGLKDKLTHAGIYGINMSKSTIEDLLDIKINYTVKVGFETVIKIVDQLDGIDINSDQAMSLRIADGSTTNPNKICTYTVGVQHVDGDCALRFARERKSYTTGDRHRGENQQQVITAIINKLTAEKSYLTKLPDILNATANSFETSLPRDNITALIRHQLNSGKPWTVESISVDGAGSMQPTYSMGSNLPLYVMLPDQASLDIAKQQIDIYLAK